MLNETTHSLIDHTLVAQAFAMRRRVELPEPLQDGPVLPRAQAYGSVLRDPATGLLRMWYLTAPAYREYFATSQDGVSWELPDLGLLPENEFGNRNAFLEPGQLDANGHRLVGDNGPEGFCVLDAEMQDHPAAKARFTAMYLAGFGEGVSGLCIAYSDDGIRWVADEHNPVIPSWMDTSASLVWDPDTRRYSVYGRPPVRVTVVVEANRYVSRMESEDLINWSPPRTVLNTDDADADPWDQVDEGSLSLKGRNEVLIRGKNRQVYGMSVFKSAGVYIGLARMYDVPSGGGWIELAHSSDGVEWFREPLREPYMAPRPGTWDHPMLLTTVTSPPVEMGDDLWIYHAGSITSHHEAGSYDGRGIGCRTVRAGRWVGYHSADVEAELLTHPVPAGAKLTLNAATRPNGWIRVAVIGEWGEEIPGCGIENATPISGDSIAHDVRWGELARLASGHESIRLRIRSENASVWGFEMRD